MKLTKYFVILVGIVSMLGSCTMEKKQYSAGYHVEWKFLKNGKGEAQPAWQRGKTKIAHQAPKAEIPAVQASEAKVEIVFFTPDQEEFVAFAASSPAAAKPAAASLRIVSALAKAGILKAGHIEKSSSVVMNPGTKKDPSPVNNGPGEVQWKAFVIALFFGVFGLHRFYLGYNWQGWVQLFTAGGLGIWWLIDLVRIGFGRLQPKGDSYRKAFYK